MEPAANKIQQCQFLYGKNIGNFKKDEQCKSQAETPKTYCKVHLAAVRKRISREAGEQRDENEATGACSSQQCQFVYGRTTGNYAKDEQCKNQAEISPPVGYCKVHLSAVRKRKSRGAGDAEAARNRLTAEHEADCARKQQKRADEDFRLTENEANRIRQQQKRTHEQFRVAESEAKRLRTKETNFTDCLEAIETELATSSNWPSLVPPETTWQCIDSYLTAMAPDNNVLETCCVCGALERRETVQVLAIHELFGYCHLLHAQEGMETSAYSLTNGNESENEKSVLAVLENVVLERKGLAIRDTVESSECTVCTRCKSASRDKLPLRALANDLHPGHIPEELRDLTLVEEQFIALYRCKVHVINLVSHAHDDESRQRALRGNCITFAQKPGSGYKKLPAPVADVAKNVLVVFTGSKRPTAEELAKVFYLTVNRERIRAALVWLQLHNPAYAHVEIDEDNLANLPERGVPQEMIDMAQIRIRKRRVKKQSGEERDISLSDSDDASDGESEKSDDDEEEEGPAEIIRSGAVDIDANAVGHEALESNMLQNLEDSIKRNVLLYPHASRPTEDFKNEDLIAGIYPSLFPYGLARFDSQRRKLKVSFELQLQHFLKLADRRFARHPSFMFVCFNVSQRHKACMRARMIMERPYFTSCARNINSISKDEVKQLLEQQNDRQDSTNVRELNQQIKILGMNIPGSVYSKMARRNEIRGLIVRFGVPSLFVTINPSDLHCILLLQFGGYEVPLDLPALNRQYPVKARAKIVAENPVAACQFFDRLITATISCLFGYKKPNGGIFGHVNAYFGMVESQCRGSLHWHGLLWIAGAPSSEELHTKLANSEFASKLIAYLDSIICSDFPKLRQVGEAAVLSVNITDDCIGTADATGTASATIHPALMQSPQPPTKDACQEERKKYDDVFLEDLNKLVERIGQIHKHSATCHKYGQNECRFRFPSNLVDKTHYDAEQGTLFLKRSHEMVNQFNPVLTSCLRCNTDVKFIGMNKNDALATMYYITNYITKSGLAFSNGEVLRKAILTKAAGPTANNCTCDGICSCDAKEKARSMILRCFIATSGQQEISAPQIAGLILGIGRNGECYSSHEFEILHYGAFISYLKHQLGDSSQDADNDENIEQEQASSDLDGNHQREGFVLEETGDGTFTMTNAVMDYVHRGQEMDDISLYEFKACYKKARIPKAPRSTPEPSPSQCEVFPECERDWEAFGLEAEADEETDDVCLVSQMPKRGKPANARFAFVEPHPHAVTHVMKRMDEERIPVLLGPSIPSVNDVAKREQYAMILLVLLKPWRHGSDLKPNGQSWTTAFAKWVTSPQLSASTRTAIDNIESLQKAKAQAQQDAIIRRETGSSEVNRAGAMRDFEQMTGFDAESRLAIVESEDLLRPNLLEMMEVENNEQKSEYVASAMQHLEELGIFTKDGSMTTSARQIPSCDNTSPSVQPGNIDVWMRELQIQRTASLLQNFEQRPDLQNMAAAATLMGESTSASEDRREDEEPSLEERRTLTAIAKAKNLNSKQEMAFKIVARHLDETIQRQQAQNQQLFMVVCGEAGTGKTFLLKAIVDYFISIGQRHLLRLVAPTGSAALNLAGSTIHSLIGKVPHKDYNGERDLMTSKSTKAVLENQLKNCQYVIVDEFSMLGNALFGELKDDGNRTKFPRSQQTSGYLLLRMQFDPVLDMAIYKMPKNLNVGATKRKALAMKGYSSYRQFSDVVILTEQCRQCDPQLHKLLQDIREERCCSTTFAILEKRLLQYNTTMAENAAQLLRFIVSRNELRAELNKRLLENYAAELGHTVQSISAIDTHRKQDVSGRLKEALSIGDDSKTGRLIHRLDLSDGCPVVLTHNIATELGLVNGAIGKLHKVVCDPQMKGKVKSYAIVEFDTFTGECSGLPAKCVPIQAVTRTIEIEDPVSKKQISVRRTQIPLSLGFAITDYRSQGKTLINICIDLVRGSRKGTHASLYVMLSRVKRLEDLFILRPFSSDVLNFKLPPDLKAEITRLGKLAEATSNRFVA